MSLNNEDLDAIRELVNIGVGRAAAMLNEITCSHIILHVPTLQVIRIDELDAACGLPVEGTAATVKIDFKGFFTGTTALIFPPESAAALVMAITGENGDQPELDAIRIETLTEVGNIFINGVMGSIGNVLGQQITYTPPLYVEDSIAQIVWNARFHADERVLLANTRFFVEDINVEGIIAMILEIGSLETLLEKIAAVRGE
ncbi:chemotaxis protein CheC [Methanofollis fontis]|uniref:Chemotaxis protein CheC n=1 Tax=Methanofollis fontis TaxID=2052832 RepID=A0A483CUS0_9EURY|nr:chemotaxis protein CheC [Methanofollis fontis]TAJ45197.1 chemotaxis protein CheC [Methanofollis fontis]